MSGRRNYKKLIQDLDIDRSNDTVYACDWYVHLHEHIVQQDATYVRSSFSEKLVQLTSTHWRNFFSQRENSMKLFIREYIYR